jgi:hypothetical protein
MYEQFSVMIGESFREAVEEFYKNGTSLSGGSDSFQQGYSMGLHRMFTLIEQAADVCGVSLEDIGLSELSESDFLRN